MSYMVWSPIRELDALRRQLEREVDRIFESFTDSGPATAPWSRSLGRYPLLNLSEDKDNIYVEVLAPGVTPESLEITVVRDTLRIAGDKQPLHNIKPEQFHRSERDSGKFARTITLPVQVDGDSVKADYKNGLLLITLPKAPEAKPKQISVNIN